MYTEISLQILEITHQGLFRYEWEQESSIEVLLKVKVFPYHPLSQKGFCSSTALVGLGLFKIEVFVIVFS